MQNNRMYQRAVLVLFLLISANNCLAQGTAAATAKNKWEDEIAAFEVIDRKQSYPKNAVLFVGSSTIRLWKTLVKDFPGTSVINRGFGGSQIADSVHFADRIIIPYTPRLVVIYAGGNDIASGKTPQSVFEDYKKLVEKIQTALPQTHIAYIAIMPNPARWHLDNEARKTNELIKSYVAGGKRLAYIDAYTAALTADGKLQPELYVEDKLHLNEKGYKVLQSVVAPYLK